MASVPTGSDDTVMDAVAEASPELGSVLPVTTTAPSFFPRIEKSTFPVGGLPKLVVLTVAVRVMVVPAAADGTLDVTAVCVGACVIVNFAAGAMLGRKLSSPL